MLPPARLALILALMLTAPVLASRFGAAQAADRPPAVDYWSACRRAIAATEPGSGVPPGLLNAIALVETGRPSPQAVPQPWPWAYNAGGESHFAASKSAAIAEVKALQAGGLKSIDVGCMQINLMHHPEAFRDLEEAFDPGANLRYAARFLRALQAETGDWGSAIARYHSGEAERGLAYSRRVALARLGQAWGGGGPVPLSRDGMKNVCAPGLQPMLLFGGAREARRFMTPEARRAGRAVLLPRTTARPRLVCARPARMGSR